MDKEYWKNYYERQEMATRPSLFALFVLKNYIRENSSLLELGCGNGRDSIFFASNNIKVTAVDQCEDEIKILVTKNKFPNSNLTFVCADFTKFDNKIESFDNIYSRFTLHSIKGKEEEDIVRWAYKHLNNGGKLFIEARGKKNELYKLGNPVNGEPDAFTYNNHYRRFIDIENLREKLSTVGFKILLAEEKSGFAPFSGINQKFIRIIASKD